MISFKNLIHIDRSAETPIYLQLHNAIINMIKSGVIKSGAKLPGTRSLSLQIGLHRKTVIAAYDELMGQGWINTIPAKGTFVSDKLPEVKPRGQGVRKGLKLEAGFSFEARKHLHRPYAQLPSMLTIDEGIPDVRIAPIVEILRHYRSIVSRSYNAKYLSYGSFFGDDYLREVLANYLQETRGITCSKENILITRGSQMGMYLASQLIHQKGGFSIVGETNYIAASLTLTDAGASLLRVRVDKNGLNTNDIQALCEKHKIKSVYVTSHHHHPTTVTLSPERRLHLIELAHQYGFAILEDDYDYDFHYQRAPLLPLASADEGNHVIYMGAVCKIIAPAIRVGYMVGPSDFITAAAHLRRTIDRQGDTILERALAQMIEQGDLQRHSRKALKLYHERRDHFHQLLTDHLSEFISFSVPEGGMAFWVKLKKGMNWEAIAKTCLENEMVIPDWKNYDSNNSGHNGIRLGFASLNFEEQTKAVLILKSAMKKESQN